MNRLARVALFSAASILSSASALAADLPARAPVAPVAYVPAFSWTGFYLGGALGWIETNPEYTTGALVLGTPFIVSSASNRNGLSYGILSGYNYQMGQVVLGVEGDFTGGPLARYGTPPSPAIFLRRTASGVVRSVDGSVMLPTALCSI